jgi:hypothetical protein
MKKKNILILLVVGLIATTAANAQKEQNNGLEYGIKAGVNLSSFNYKSSFSDGVPADAISINLTGNRTTFIGGGFITIPISGGFKLQSELLYAGLGGKKYQTTIFDANSSESDSLNLKFSYLAIPVLAKYRFGQSGFSVLAGPQIGILLSAKDDLYGTDIKSTFKDTDFSGVVGAEYALPIGINFSARYQLGFSNILKGQTSGTTTTGTYSTSLKNNAFAITVGYKLGKK